jgi:PTS system cellobiose-specific IIC component
VILYKALIILQGGLLSMSGFMNFMETKFVPVAAKIGAQRHLVAVRDSFAATMPILIAGSLAVLVNNLQVTGDAATDPYQTLMPKIFGEGFKAFGGNIWWGTFAILSLFIAFLVAYNLAKSYDAAPLQAGLISVATFFIFLPQVSPASGGWGDINWGFLNSNNLFTAIFVGIIVAEAFRLLSKSKYLVIKMPDMVPPAVSRSFAALLPSMIILAVASWAQIFLFANTSLFALILDVVGTPIAKVGNTFAAALFLPLFAQVMWFFGLHGSNIIDPVMQAVFVPAVIANADAIVAGLEPVNIVTKSFYDAFVNMGGSGATLALIGAILVGSKRKDYRLTAGMSAGPGLFNINESVTYGLPIVLNPLMLIPFILVPLVLTTTAYVSTAIGLVPMTSVVIPWVSPPILGGFLATAGSPMGALLSLVNLVLAFFIYLPFVRMANKAIELKENKDAA